MKSTCPGAALALAFAAVLPSARPVDAAPRKHTESGYTYYIDKRPAWVDEAKPGPSRTAPSPGWHYLLRDHQVFLDGETQKYARTIRKVQDASGLTEAARVSLSFDPSYQKATLHEVRIRRDGKHIDRLDPRAIKLLRRETGLERGLYDGLVTANLVLPDVRVGDEIEYSYTLAGQNPVFEGRFAALFTVLGEKAATATSRYRLLHPAARDIRVQPAQGFSETESTLSKPGWRERIFIASDVPVWNFAPDASPADMTGSLMQVSEYSDWASVAAFGGRLFARTAPERSLRELADALRVNHPSTEQRALAALDFVQREIRYFSISFGDSSHKPASPVLVLERRFGDCKDKTALLVALLGELGIKSSPVLVSQFLRGSVSELLPSPFAFDHVILAAEVNGAILWLDATRHRQSGPLAGRSVWTPSTGLSTAEGTRALGVAPQGVARPFDAEATDTFTVSSFAQPTKLRSELVLRGEMAELMREILDRPEGSRFRDSLFEYIGRRFASSIEPLAPTAVTDRDGTVTITREFLLADPWDYRDAKVLVLEYGPWMVWDTLRPGTDPSRTQSFAFGPARRFAHRVVVQFPAPVYAESLQKSQSVEGKHFRAGSSWSQRPDGFEQTTTVELLTETVDREDLSAYAAKVRELANTSALALPVNPVPVAEWRELMRKLEGFDKARNGPAFETAEQMRATVEDMVYTAHLSHGRLTPRNRATALQRRAIARDHASRQDEALADIEAARTLSPDDRTIGLTLAEVLFGQGRFKEANDALAKLPGAEGASRDSSFLHKRGRTRFYLGDAAGAASDFTAMANATSGVQRQYSLLWLYTTSAAAGLDAPAAVKPFMQSASEQWPQAILRHLAGEATEADVLKAARNPNSSVEKSQLCEAHFFVGLHKRIAGDHEGARRSFESARATKVYEYIEYRAAGFELERLGSTR